MATLPASALILALFCVDAYAVSQTRKDITELQRNFFILQSDIADLKAQIDRMPSDDDFKLLRQSQADILTQVQDLLREVQVLRGRFEESRYFTDRLLNETSAEMDVLSAKVDASAGVMTKKEAEELVSRVGEIEALVKTIDARLAKLEDAIAVPTDEGPEVEKRSPEEEYNIALAAFKAEKYDKARDLMETFITSHPDHDLAGNAQYWVADSYYAEKEYADAILAYEDLLQKYKGHSKIPAALLKQGLAFIERGDEKAAKGIFRELVANHPDSEQAKTAQEKLDKLEGKEKKAKPAPPKPLSTPEGPPAQPGTTESP
jgi:tol-pal system protein YbgF